MPPRNNRYSYLVSSNRSKPCRPSARVVLTIIRAACTAVAISMLPGTLATCEGPYRPRTASRKAGILSWSHANDERCEMHHDKAGHAWVALGTSIAKDGSGEAYEVPHSEYWISHADAGGVAGSAGDGANVVCTSAGRTTRLVFGLVESREGINSPRANHDSGVAQSYDSPRDNARLVSTQDGSIISAGYSNIHLRLSRGRQLRQTERNAPNVLGTHLADENACGTALCVKITMDGKEMRTTSLETMAIQGIRLPHTSYGIEGTHVFEVCIFEQDRGETTESRLDRKQQGCTARAVLALEIFSAGTQMIRSRSTSETVLTPSVMGSDVEVEKYGARGTRVLFLVDLAAVDGIKLSTLHLLKHLPGTFRASTLDLSCACEYVLYHTVASELRK